jgi:hypothetical protein
MLYSFYVTLHVKPIRETKRNDHSGHSYRQHAHVLGEAELHTKPPTIWVDGRNDAIQPLTLLGGRWTGCTLSR